jgi:hypothetical protein
MSPEDRHSEALETELITDPEEKAHREAKNGVRQFDRAVEMIEWWLQPEKRFSLRPSALLDLNRIALDGLSSLAGTYRPGDVATSPVNPLLRSWCASTWIWQLFELLPPVRFIHFPPCVN